MSWARLGLAHASGVPLPALSRGNAQRALVAQALLADPDLLVLDEPSGGMDADGVTRVAAEIRRAAGRRAVVLVARHPTAPLPLPSGLAWRLRDGAVSAFSREGDSASPAVGLMEVETGDGTVQRVDEAGLPAVLRAALDAGLAIRGVRPAWGAAGQVTGPIAGELAGDGPAGEARPGTAAVTAITLVPVLTWLAVLAHRACGRELARAFAAHVGGRARAHLATDLGLVPFALLLALAALVAPLISQGEHPHPAALDLRIVGLHLAAAVFGPALARCSR